VRISTTYRQLITTQLLSSGFLRLLRWCFTAITVVCCLGLGPVDIFYNLKNVASGKRNTLSMLTIENVHDTSLYAHVVAIYAISESSPTQCSTATAQPLYLK
jgi:hypothetical protein